ncbi:DUF7289 family protein [Salinilacihabitans rarus]|uniref:DUF7289 family protein n=1 Tax=Salinilacihabitans rarus TaxID=2961596 RepID=UPI0020C88E76|nr:hypothetical protein [Salinilacihabitans rarus]
MRTGGRNRDGETDRAVSEVVGFVLVFGIIIGSVGLLYAVGFQTMDAYQETEQLRNAERGMEALADNFNDVVRYDAIRQRSGEIALRDGRLRTTDGSNVTITVTNDSGTTDSPLGNDGSNVGALVYEYEGTTISYEGGGVFRNQTDGDVAVSYPQMRCADDAAIVTLVAVADGPGTIQTSSGTEITVTENRADGRSVSETYENADVVEIEIDSSNHQNSWESTAERNGWSDGGGGTYTCDVDRAHIEIVVVDVDY